MYKYLFVVFVAILPAVFFVRFFLSWILEEKRIMFWNRLLNSLLKGTVVGQDEISCKGMDLNMTDAQRGHITECLRENGIKSVWKIPVEKLPVSAFP